MDNHLTLTLLKHQYAVCQLAQDRELPPWIAHSEVRSLARTPTEMTAVCEDRFVPADVRANYGLRCLRGLGGQFGFAMTGILASIVGLLAAVGVSISAFSTFNTDYVLFRNAKGDVAHVALAAAGHTIHSL